MMTQSVMTRLGARALSRLGSLEAVRSDLAQREELARGLMTAIRIQSDRPDAVYELTQELQREHFLIAEDRAALAGVSSKVNIALPRPTRWSFGNWRQRALAA
jgi:hypothetical protein